jgi:hypothetical protein
MALLVLLLRSSGFPASIPPAKFGYIPDACAGILRRARRDGLPVVHFYQGGPPGARQLPECEPRQFERILCCPHELSETIGNLRLPVSNDRSAGLTVGGYCDMGVFRLILEQARTARVRLDLARAGFKLLPSMDADKVCRSA